MQIIKPRRVGQFELEKVGQRPLELPGQFNVERGGQAAVDFPEYYRLR